MWSLFRRPRNRTFSPKIHLGNHQKKFSHRANHDFLNFSPGLQREPEKILCCTFLNVVDKIDETSFWLGRHKSRRRRPLKLAISRCPSKAFSWDHKEVFLLRKVQFFRRGPFHRTRKRYRFPIPSLFWVFEVAPWPRHPQSPDGRFNAFFLFFYILGMLRVIWIH